MAADPIIYCLQELTDYDQFERLCSDVMAGLDYPGIEPLGGRADKGRDAIFANRGDPASAAVFSYSVRQDWRTKLDEDCEKVRKHGHSCRRFVFVNTSSLTANDKDVAKKEVHDKFGWDLVIYDLERLRVELTGPLRHLIPRHPQIFCPPWFPVRGGVSIAPGRDLLVIDHTTSDHAIATWLSRRLQLAGYSTWCLGTAPLAGETIDDTVRVLIANRAIRYLPILSTAGLQDSDLMSRCGLAANEAGLVVPCIASVVEQGRLPSRLQSLVAAKFDDGWLIGLKSLLDVLDAQGIPKGLSAERGEAIALRSFVPEPVTIAKPEPLYASVFPVTEFPSVVRLYRTAKSPNAAEIAEARQLWAFCQLSSNFYLTFHRPPNSISGWKLDKHGEWRWQDYPELHGKRSYDVVKELIRRCLEVACFGAGLKWCTDREILYFPEIGGPQRNVSFVDPGGVKSRVNVTGLRQFGYGDRAKPYHYQLAPTFRIGSDTERRWWVTTRVYVRVTDPDGTPLKGKTITSRRKHVSKSWWNQHWFARTLGVMQAVSEDGREIVVSDGEQRVAVSTAPLTWNCPVSIDNDAVDRIGDFQEEMASLRYVENDTEDAETDE